MNDNIIVAVTQCAERLGWTVQTDIPKENNVVIFEFYKFSPAGQDFGFSVGMEGNELANLVGNMEDYYNAFDADEETYLWLDNNGHGKNGAPYHMRDVLDDMEAVEDMIGELLGAIRDVEIDIE